MAVASSWKLDIKDLSILLTVILELLHEIGRVVATSVKDSPSWR